MKTGIIILNYNDYENTLKIIDMIKDYKCLKKIIIVDNASTDDSFNHLKPLENNKIIIIKNKKNLGYAYGNNLGLKYLYEHGFDYAIISNPDIIVEESVMEELISRMKNSKVSFLGPKILEHGNIIKGWKTPSYLYELLSTMNYFHKYAKKLITYKDSYYKDGLNEVDVIHGCFFIGRLKDFKKINFFDTNTFLYYEENILSYKAKKNNLGIYVDTSISVIHNLSLSVDKSLNKLKKYKILKDSMFYYETRYRKINIFKYILLRIVYYISYMVGFVTFWV